jgi:hypothetical protein
MDWKCFQSFGFFSPLVLVLIFGVMYSTLALEYDQLLMTHAMTLPRLHVTFPNSELL